MNVRIQRLRWPGGDRIDQAFLIQSLIICCLNLSLSPNAKGTQELTLEQDANVLQSSAVMEQVRQPAIRPNGAAIVERDGLDLILNKRFLPPDFDQETFDNTWQVWPKHLKRQAEKASKAERTRLAFKRYGFTPRADEPHKPLQFVVDANGAWAMNCFACHGGSLYGSEKSYPGLPNNRIALETLYEDLRKTKRLLKKPYGIMDVGSSLIPMGTSVGTSNAVIFGVSLMAPRDKHINLRSVYVPPIVRNHDMDAPPWWHYKMKKMIYIDGFTQKHHRALMPFMMVRQNNGPKFRSMEDDFRQVQKFIETVQPPAYPHPIDRKMAAHGQKIFDTNCSTCHGSYGEKTIYPELTVSLDEVETDDIRHLALSKTYRRKYGESWLADYGKARTIADPVGYVAPPLTGVWATAPYLHNGSVPTLRTLIKPDQRPTIWTRKRDGYDDRNGGLVINVVEKMPEGITSSEKRMYFDTRKYGKKNSGHDFGKDLSRLQVDQLIEYLKTL